MINIRQALFVGLAVAATAVAGSAAEKSIKESEVPKPVRDAVSQSYPSAKVKGFNEESEGGKVTYEAELEAGGKRTEAIFSKEGQLLMEEQPIAFKELPEAVRSSFASSPYAKAEVRKVEKVTTKTTPSKVVYELDIKHNGKTHELAFSSTGERLEPSPTGESGR